MSKISDQELKDLFAAIDTDKSGFLSREEISEALKKVGFDDGLVNEVIKLCDGNNDGKISSQEFISALRKLESEAEAEDK